MLLDGDVFAFRSRGCTDVAVSCIQAVPFVHSIRLIKAMKIVISYVISLLVLARAKAVIVTVNLSALDVSSNGQIMPILSR